MGDKKRQKFSLGDIIKKINEEKASSAPMLPAEQNSPHIKIPEDSNRDLPVGAPPQPLAPPPRFSLPPSEASQNSAPEYSPAIAANHDRMSGVAALPVGERLHAKLDVPLYSSTPGSEEESVDFDLMRYIGVMIRRKNIIIAVIVIAFGFSLFSYFKAIKFYTAHTRMLFKYGSDKDIMGNNNSDMYTYWDSRDERLNTHLELIKSQIVLERVSENLQHAIDPGDIAGALSIVCGGKDGQKTDIVEVSFSHSSAEMARNVSNELCKTYMEYIKEVNVQDITRLIAKLDEQIGKVDKDLNQKENALQVFKEKNRAVELTSETNMTISKLSQMELAKQQTQLDMLESREKFTGLKKEINQQQVDVVQSMTYQNPYQSKLAELELHLSTLSAEYSPEHYKVQMVKAEIDKIKNAMKFDISKEAASQTYVKNPIRQSLLQDLVNVTIEKSALEAKRAAQEQLVKQLDLDLGKLPALELHYAQLMRETESLLQVLKLLKSRFEEAKIKRDSQESDLKILEWAQTPGVAISNVKFSKILMSIFIGLIIGIALALLIEYLDQTIKEPPDVEKTLELPLLGIVPTIDTEKAIIEVTEDHGKTILEPFRALRANLKHIALSRHIKTLIISSAVKGEGKTTLAANIAITLAMDGKKVILVDGDMRRAQIHGLFHLAKKDGLCDYLYGAAEVHDVLKPTVHQNLFVITTGEHPQNPAELLGSFRFDQLVKELRAQADYVIFDSPALLPVSDGITMAPKMDACIMVVRALWTPLKAARQAKNQLNRIGCTIIGAILNGISHSRGYYPYYYGYYRYYAYKYSYDEETPKKYSLRAFGVRAESKFKSILQGVRLSLPHWISGTQNFIRDLIKRKTFWILLFLLAGISLFNSIKNHGDSGVFPKQSITFLGENRDSDKQGLKHENLPKGIALESINQGLAQAFDSASIVPKDTFSPREIFSFSDSLAFWQNAYNTKNSARFLEFYDRQRFQYPGGTYTEWEKEISTSMLQDSLRHSTIHLDSVWQDSLRQPYSTTNVIATKRSLQGVENVSITFIWQNTNACWRIIREKQRTR